MDNSKVKVNITLLIQVRFMKEISIITKFMEEVLWYGQTRLDMRVNLRMV